MANEYPFYNYNTQAPMMNSSGASNTTQKTAKKRAGLGKRILASILCGILLGISAGIGFVGVTQIANRFEPKQSEKNVASGSKEEALPAIGIKDPDAAGVAGDGETEYPTISSTTLQDTPQTEGAVMTPAQVAKTCMPAVVSIINTFTETYTYFGQKYSETGRASGTGIIIGQSRDELLIVTNYHVIEAQESLEITFIDETTAAAYVKGYDETMDIAVISVRLSELSEATMGEIAVAILGDSDTLEVGESAVAIGNALGYGQSVTVGVISALNREVEIDGSVHTLIQTDAAINPGNSGGALLNLHGEVIGINSSKIGGSAVEGMCYAIPISLVKDLIEQLSLQETLIRVESGQEGYLGIYGQDVDDEVASLYDIPKGVYISQVIEGEAAFFAGLQKGDIITSIAGRTITGMDELTSLLKYHAAGTEVEVIYQRKMDGFYQEQKATVVLGSRKQS